MTQDIKWRRTHQNDQLRPANTCEQVTLVGWVQSIRDHGGVIFVDLRDRWGHTQVVFHPENEALINRAKRLNMETVIGIQGVVVKRPDEMVNSNLDTGGIEVDAEILEVFNKAKPTPFVIKDPPDANDETRFKYRYLDLRRPSIQNNMLLRHKTAQTVRRYFDAKDFVEIETPVLMKSTPEGARDYLVPSRINKGKFYALPQSPQTYKQLLMISGFDRYFQIVKCFRDEDLRADRQPEFTQIDVEMSFVDEEAIFEVMEGLMQQIFKDVLGQELSVPFQRMPFDDVLLKYGVDRPDLRFSLEIQDISDLAPGCGFQVFENAVQSGGVIRGFKLPQVGPLSRKQTDQLMEFVKPFGARGLVFVQYLEGEIKSPIAKFVGDPFLQKLGSRFDVQTGDVLFIVAAEQKVVCDALGNLRNKLAADFNLIPEDKMSILWVTDFPLLEWDAEAKRYVAMHHPFTSPRPEDVSLMDSDPGKVRAREYDLVLNGSEIAGGSIRIHQSAMQSRMFDLLGIDKVTAKQKFGHLIEALDYGAPPHGGIAFGFDRLVAMLAGEASIREVIAFPKTTSALSLMDGCPSEVDNAQLKELGIKLI
ncbi:aspartate--tRNA ligase [candidate division KSB1 bacterium]|nr:aspartate--tRNA ligase [candidate division KSB1 bacterium]